MRGELERPGKGRAENVGEGGEDVRPGRFEQVWRGQVRVEMARRERGELERAG